MGLWDDVAHRMATRLQRAFPMVTAVRAGGHSTGTSQPNASTGDGGPARARQGDGQQKQKPAF